MNTPTTHDTCKTPFRFKQPLESLHSLILAASSAGAELEVEHGTAAPQWLAQAERVKAMRLLEGKAKQ